MADRGPLCIKAPGTAVTLSGRPKAILAYRVRSCRTSSTCSGYRTGPSVAVNPRQLVNLYSKYPILSTIDQRVAAYKATVPAFPSVLPRAPVGGRSSGAGTARIDPNEQRFYLGDGFDVIRGGLKEFCLDVNHPALTINRSPPLQPSTFDVSHVTDNRHLADLLEVSASAKVGLTDDDFALGLSGEKMILKSVSDETHERLVVKFVQRAELWRLSTPMDAIIPELTSQVLIPNSDDAKADFRERCGDKFINAVNLGGALHMVFDFDSKKFDRDERQARKGQLGLAIGEIFSGNVAGSISTSTQLLLSQLNVKIHADQVGGLPGARGQHHRDKLRCQVQRVLPVTEFGKLGSCGLHHGFLSEANCVQRLSILADLRGLHGALRAGAPLVGPDCAAQRAL